jgi:ComF family protein
MAWRRQGIKRQMSGLSTAPSGPDRSVIRSLRGLAGPALNAILPPRCLACGTIVEQTASLCPACWPQVRFITEPLCAVCGVPFEFAVEDDSICAACVATPRVYARARAAVAYDDGTRRFILGFKNADRTDAVRMFSPWMIAAGRDLIADADVLAPVPLHWTRLFVRKYNQAALLAQAIARLTAKPVAVDLLRRTRRTRKLGTSGPLQREETVRAAFVVPPRRCPLIVGRRVLLIDDVFTTGSTTASCAQALKQAGAAAVDVLTLARAVRPSVAGGPRPAMPRETTPGTGQENGA